MQPDAITIEDEVFGTVRVHTGEEGRLIEVTGEEIPHATLRRQPDGEVREDVPIGTRDAAALTMTLNGQSCHLRPAPGRLVRSSYRIHAVVGTVAYQLTPTSPTDSRLLVDRRMVGRLSREQTIPIHAAWREGAQPEHAAVGYLLVASFGAGAHRALRLLVDSLLDYPG